MEGWMGRWSTVGEGERKIGGEVESADFIMYRHGAFCRT